MDGLSARWWERQIFLNALHKWPRSAIVHSDPGDVVVSFNFPFRFSSGLRLWRNIDIVFGLFLRNEVSITQIAKVGRKTDEGISVH